MGFLETLTDEEWRELKAKAMPLGTESEWTLVREVLQGAELATPIDPVDRLARAFRASTAAALDFKRKMRSKRG